MRALRGGGACGHTRARIYRICHVLHCMGDLVVYRRAVGIIREQEQLLADVELAASLPDAAVAGSEVSRCLLTAVTRAPRPPPPGAGGGRFGAAAADAVRVRRLGRIVRGPARGAPGLCSAEAVSMWRLCCGGLYDPCLSHLSSCDCNFGLTRARRARRFSERLCIKRQY